MLPPSVSHLPPITEREIDLNVRMMALEDITDEQEFVREIEAISCLLLGIPEDE